MRQRRGRCVCCAAPLCSHVCVAAAIEPPSTHHTTPNPSQVFVGRSFACYVTHEDGKYIYFYIGQTGFCVYAA